jgi:dihydroxy-acid dehydratase
MGGAANIRQHTNETPVPSSGDRPGGGGVTIVATRGFGTAGSHLGTAHRCRLAPHDPTEAFKRTPCAADLQPAGRHIDKHMVEAVGVPLLLRTLLDHGHLPGERLTVTGRAVAGNLRSAERSRDQAVVHPADRPLSASGGVVGLRGNLSPAGAIVKVAGMADLQSIASARCFDGEDAHRKAVKKKHYREGEVLVIRYAEPGPGPGMRGMRATTVALRQGPNGSAVLLGRSRFSGAISDFLSGYRRRPAGPDGAVARARADLPEAQQRRPAAAVERVCHACV